MLKVNSKDVRTKPTDAEKLDSESATWGVLQESCS